MYVAVMMAVAEATSPQGSMLGAVITLLFYGVAPVALVMYLLSTPARRRALRAAEAQADAARADEAQKAQAAQSTLAEMAPVEQTLSEATKQVTHTETGSAPGSQPH